MNFISFRNGCLRFAESMTDTINITGNRHAVGSIFSVTQTASRYGAARTLSANGVAAVNHYGLPLYHCSKVTAEEKGNICDVFWRGKPA